MFKKLLSMLLFVFLIACSEDNGPNGEEPLNPNTAPRASVDRFSQEAGNLMVRTDENGLPGPNEPINYDMAPFLTKGLGPGGQMVQYYNFDVMPTTPAPIYVLFEEGSDAPVSGQINIVNVIPGDPGYSDFWRVNKVTVPEGYTANTVTSYSELIDKGYQIQQTDIIVNCPVVPEGSSADQRYGGGKTGLVMGWYNDQVIFYFDFSEKSLMTTGNGMVPVSDIYVSFNINPGQQGGGPASGFMTESNSDQTHNVVETIPTDNDYSPLWDVNIYDNADFDMVSNLQSAMSANILAEGAALVNCPIVSVQ